jgi:glycosyltransferase involved in cell wall biosynthesis
VRGRSFGRWLLVSKPLRHPFRDGTTVLAGTLVRGLKLERPLSYFGDPGMPLREGADDRVISAAAMGYAPGLREKARVLATMLDPRHADAAVHAFLTPSKATAAVLSTLRLVRPRRPIVLTVTSSAGVEVHADQLARLDALIVASDNARDRLVERGVARERVHRIYPGVEVEPDAQRDPSRPLRLLYAGDLDPATVERLIGVARLLRRPELSGWTLVIASRPKGPMHQASRGRVIEALGRELASGRVELLGEVTDMDALLRSATIQLYIADHVERKVDLPLVLLEGLARGVALCTLDFAPVGEIFARARLHGLQPGLAVSPRHPQALAVGLAEAMADPGVLLRWSADARELVKREFSATRMVSEYDALYDAIGGERGHDNKSNLLRRFRRRLRPGS